MTLHQHDSFVKVVDANGTTVARCDKLTGQEKWRLTYFVCNTMVERMVDAADSVRSVIAVAAVLHRPS